jgi:Na+-transporting methylmalonyl-CoA/oxaloacetate decarboxylase gamma subunit
MTRLCVLSVLVVKMPVPSITVRRVAKQHDKMLTTENTADTKFLNKGITQTIIAAAICVNKKLRPRLLESASSLTSVWPLSKDGLKRISL